MAKYTNIVRLDMIIAEEGRQDTLFNMLYVPLVKEGYTKSVAVGEYELFAEDDVQLLEVTVDEYNGSKISSYCERTGIDADYFELD